MTLHRPRFSFALLAVSICFSAAQAKTLVVNPALKAANDANPGTEAQPFRTIGRAAALVQPGDTVRIYSGLYREAVVIKQSGTKDKPIRFEAAPGATVIVTGADRITDWKRESGDGNLFSAEWPHPASRTHPNDDYHLLIGRPEQVFVQGYLLRLVPSKDKLTRGTFWIDGASRRLWAQSLEDRDLSAKSSIVEVSVRPLLWSVEGAYVDVRGLRFRWASNHAQSGAAAFTGRGDVVEDCVFERNNGAGAKFAAEDIVVRRSEFSENGQLGFSANHAHHLLLSECLIRENNVKNFSRGWEAGGNKLVMCRGVVIERCTFSGNHGSGIWFDIGNEDSTVRQCLIENNQDGGIFYEISFGLHAHDNVIIGNGLADTPGAWGSQAGINLSSSPGCVIERNLLIGNREGFDFREQRRTTKRIGGDREEPVWNHDQTIRNNVIAYNVSAQVAGWFDVADERCWPRSLQQATHDTKAPAEDLAGKYGAKTMQGQPTGLSLEALNLKFASNLFARYPGQSLVQWGATWKHHRIYQNLPDVRADLKLDTDSIEADLPFADATIRDFRLPADHPALRLKCMPEGPIPGVQLGAIR
jgi:hypothetical protein